MSFKRIFQPMRCRNDVEQTWAFNTIVGLLKYEYHVLAQKKTRNDVYEKQCPKPFACQELRVHNKRGSS